MHSFGFTIVYSGNTVLSSEWVVHLIVHMYLRDSFYHIRMKIKYLVTPIISTKDTDTNTFYCQNNWRIVLCQERFKSPVFRHTVDYQCSFGYNCGRCTGLMVSALVSGSSGLGSRPAQGHCVVFLCKTLYTRGASLYLRVWMGTGEFNAGLMMD